MDFIIRGKDVGGIARVPRVHAIRNYYQFSVFACRQSYTERALTIRVADLWDSSLNRLDSVWQDLFQVKIVHPGSSRFDSRQPI
jgi:hypothetical protein